MLVFQWLVIVLVLFDMTKSTTAIQANFLDISMAITLGKISPYDYKMTCYSILGQNCYLNVVQTGSTRLPVSPKGRLGWVWNDEVTRET